MPKLHHIALLLAAPLCHAMQWDWECRGDRLPEQAHPRIELRGDASARSVKDGALHLVNPADDTKQTAMYVVRGIGARNSHGVTAEARIRAAACGGEHFLRPGVQLFVADSFCAEALLVCDGYIETRYSILRADLPTTDRFHVYRITARGDDFRIYVDGKLAINGKGRFLGTRTLFRQGAWLDSVIFGVGSPWASAAGDIDFVRYTTKGAFAPNGQPDTFAAQPRAGRKVAIEPAGNVIRGMAEGLNSYDPAIPKLGGPVQAQVLHEDAHVQLWLQDATTKVFRTDAVQPTKTDRTISLSLARNEYEPFQIVLRPKAAPIENVSVEFTDLVGDAGRIGKEHLTFNPLAYLKVYPDATLARGKTIGRLGYWPDGLLPYKSFDAKHAINYPIWVTLYCPPGTPPGRYRGAITVKGSRFGPVRLPLRVKVWRFTLPRTPRLRNDFLLNNVYNSVEKSMEAYKAMYAACAKHRGSPSRLFPGLKYEIRDGKVWIDPDNAKFVEMARYCIDELGIQHFWCPHVGPHQMLGWFEKDRKGRTWLGVPMYEDRPPYTTFTPEFEERLVDYLSKLSRFLRRKGIFERFNCLTSRNEPACPGAWKPVRSFKMEARYCDLVHRADPEFKVFMNMALVVGSPELDLIKGKVSIWAENTLGSAFKLFDRTGFIPPALVQERKAAGDVVMMYRNSHDYIDTGVGHSAMNHRVNGWIMWVTGATGYYFDNGGVASGLWSTNAWRETGRRWHGQRQWGAASQLYPGVDMSSVHPSIRFELTREAYEDYEYLATLHEFPLTPGQKRRVRKMEESIVPLYVWWRDGKRPEAFWEEGVYEGAFESDAKKLYAAREQLGEIIDQMANATK